MGKGGAFDNRKTLQKFVSRGELTVGLLLLFVLTYRPSRRIFCFASRFSQIICCLTPDLNDFEHSAKVISILVQK